MKSKKIISGFAFHCHHDKLVEWVTNYDERVEYIKACKPPGERELRLRLFKMIPIDRLPVKLVKACAEYDFTELHKELCPDCPWDGKTIFPEGEKK